MNPDTSSPQLLKKLTSLAPFLPRMYEVGGAVRDRLSGHETRDIDVALPDPKNAARLMERTFGTKTVTFNRESQTTACYRIIDKNDPAIHLDLVYIQGESIESDLARRDFTINAMARSVAPQKESEIIDPFEGKKDLRQGIIRETRPGNIHSDPLRMMRAFRLAAQLDFCIEPGTRETIRKNYSLLAKSAPERITNELRATLSSGRACNFLQEMDDLGILSVLFPEIEVMRGCEQNAYHHLNVLKHSFECCRICEEIIENPQKFFMGRQNEIISVLDSNLRRPWLKLAALMHDMGKPSCREVQPCGKITFYSHDKKGTAMAENIARRLRLSRREQEYLKLLVQEHMHIFSLSRPEVKKSTLLRFLRKAGDDLIPITILAMADNLATQGPKRPKGETKHFESWARETIYKYFAEFKADIKEKDLLTGRDLLNMGLAQGPLVGRILKEARQAQDNGIISDADTALNWARERTKHYREA